MVVFALAGFFIWPLLSTKERRSPEGGTIMLDGAILEMAFAIPKMRPDLLLGPGIHPASLQCIAEKLVRQSGHPVGVNKLADGAVILWALKTKELLAGKFDMVVHSEESPPPAVKPAGAGTSVRLRRLPSLPLRSLPAVPPAPAKGTSTTRNAPASVARPTGVR